MHSVNRHFTYPLFFFLLFTVWFNGCSTQQSSVKERPDLQERTEWIEKTLKRLTLEEKVGQMVMSKAFGYYYSTESDEYNRLVHLVKEHKFGGLIMMQGDVYETAMMVNRMQAMADIPLLVSSDFEWGAAMRIRRTTRFPEAMALAATRDTLLAYQLGEALGRESRAIGVMQVFAPVADVNINPNNPVINTRSFGENPALVSQMAGAVAMGLQSAGVIATAKHFPGHGDTDVDSHLDLPRIPASRERLDSVELVPFRELVRSGIGSIMIAHLEVPAIDKQKALPSTLSSAIVGDLLQRQLGFNGLIVTDAMDMGGLVNGFGSDSSAVRAVEAGIDILLILPDEDGAVDAIMNAVRSGRITEERINRSVRKILGYKWDLGLVQHRMVDIEKLPENVGTKDHLLVAKQIARKAITVLKNDNILPLERNGKKKILSVITSDLESYRTEIHRSNSPWPNEVVGDYFMTQFRRRYGSNTETVRIDPSSTSVVLDSIRKKARNADIILCPVFSKARSASGKFGLPASVARFLDSLSGLGKPIIVLAMGSPYTIAAFPNAAAYLCAYSDAEPITEATVEVLFGEVPALGKLPVTIPGMFTYGEGIEIRQSLVRRDFPESVGLLSDSLTRIDSVMVRAIRDKAFPGGQVLVAKDGAVVYSKSFGRLEYDSISTRVNTNTLYDIASVTKVIATTSVIMKLYDEQKIQLDDSVSKYIPEFANNGKEGITIRNLLLHNGGLPPFKRLYLTVKSPQEALDSVYQTEMAYRTGDSTVYSDFDFILLAKIAERITGVSLDWLADSLFFKPLGMTRTMFQPDSVLWPNTAPTEFDSVVRKAIVRGTVHDENAYVLGGVAGHAGLFSTASDLSVFLQMILNGGSYGGKQFLKPETVTLFTTKQSATSSRALGWDTRTVNGYSSAGSLFSAKSFGHTGFTGTSVWVDPERKIFLILLTNRVYPTRNNSKITGIRPKIADIVIKSLK